MQNMTAEKAMEAIDSGAELNVQEVRHLKKVPMDKGYRQGDISVIRVPLDFPRGKKLASRKLAIGQGEGSNHMAEGDIEIFEGTTRPKGVTSTTFLGPLIVAPKGFLNTHPKHAHFKVDEPGCYQVLHQLDARTMQRVRD